jgi:hypothetical protein
MIHPEYTSWQYELPKRMRFNASTYFVVIRNRVRPCQCLHVCFLASIVACIKTLLLLYWLPFTTVSCAPLTRFSERERMSAFLQVPKTLRIRRCLKKINWVTDIWETTLKELYKLFPEKCRLSYRMEKQDCSKSRRQRCMCGTRSLALVTCETWSSLTRLTRTWICFGWIFEINAAIFACLSAFLKTKSMGFYNICATRLFTLRNATY